MSRWRPPPEKSSPYITPQGFAMLQEEEKSIWTKRAEVTAALSAAAAEGDRSENAEYIYRKKQLREIDRRIRYLQKRLPELIVVNKVSSEDQVFFGASATLEREDGSEVTYRIVGADEIDTDSSKGYISADSPMARALLKKQIDDEFDLKIGDHKETFIITKIKYSV
ncbi:MAG: transcription elongation factor GreB [Gammaproteobacteria bacterium]|nr:transcription elongation factor GreB [Gammaproteobacteria bacterium]